MLDEREVAQRVQRIFAGLTVVGSLGAWSIWGMPGFLGFLAGAAVSFLNFRWLTRIALSVGATDTSGNALKPASAMLLVFRYLLFGAAGYAIFIVSEAGFRAALAGVFVHIAAVLAEAIYELIYAGTS